MYKLDSDSDSPVENSKFLESPFMKVKTKSEDKKEVPIHTSTTLRQTRNMNNILDSDEDVDLGFDPKEPKKSGSVMNFLDDFATKKQTPTVSNRPSTSGQAVMSRQSTATTTDSSNIFNLSRPKTTAGRRSSNNSAVAVDNLEISQPTASLANNAKLGNWLGVHFDNIESTDDIQSQNVVEKSLSNKTTRPLVVNEEEKVTYTGFESSETDNRNIKPVVGNQVEKSSTQMPITLQIEEEPNLEIILLKHYNMLVAQQKEYETFIEKLLISNKTILDSLDIQPQRLVQIMEFIKEKFFKTLKKPNFLVPSETEEITQEKVLKQSSEESFTALIGTCERDVDLKRLEMENSRLETLIANMNANYEREIEILTGSYAKQVSILEEHCQSLENYCKEDTVRKVRHLEERIEELKLENKEQTENYERSVSLLRESYENDKKQLSQTYNEHMEILKTEHQKIVNALQESHMQEISFRQDKNTYGQVLQLSMDSINQLHNKFDDFQKQIYDQMNTVTKERLEQFSLREKQMQSTERILQEAYENSKMDNTNVRAMMGIIQKYLGSRSIDKAEKEISENIKSAELLTRERNLNLKYEDFENEKQHFQEIKNKQSKNLQQKYMQLEKESAKLGFEKAKLDLERKKLEKEREELKEVLRNIEIEKYRIEEEKKDLEEIKMFNKDRAKQLAEKERHIFRLEKDVQSKMQNAITGSENTDAQVQQYKKDLSNLEQHQSVIENSEQELFKMEEALTLQQAELAKDRLLLEQKVKRYERLTCVICRLNFEHAKVDEKINNDASESSSCTSLYMP